MDILRKLFPLSFKCKETDSLVVSLIVYVVYCVVFGILTSVISSMPFIGGPMGVIGGIVGLYGPIGIVLALLVFFKVIE